MAPLHPGWMGGWSQSGHYVGKECFCFYWEPRESCSVVRIVTGYGLDDQRVGVRVPVGLGIFFSPCHADQLEGPPSSLSNGCQGLSPGIKQQGREADHSPIHLHGVVRS
jgi:hypothetical protein